MNTITAIIRMQQKMEALSGEKAVAVLVGFPHLANMAHEAGGMCLELNGMAIIPSESGVCRICFDVDLNK